MSKEALYELKETLCRELEEYLAKGELSTGDLEPIYKITKSVKNLCEILMMEEGGRGRKDGYSRDGYGRSNDYSRDGEWSANMRGNYGRENSYARTGQHYVRGHYSRDDGRQRMIEQVRRMMDEADGEDRENIRRCLETLKNM